MEEDYQDDNGEYHYGHWTSDKQRPEGNFGFVYLIIHIISGRRYVGRKQCISCSSVLKEGNKRRTKTYKESKWREYTSSCKELNAAIKKEGKNKFAFIILEWTMSRAMTTYLEAKYIWKYDALSRETLPNGERHFWNANVGSVKFLEPLK